MTLKKITYNENVYNTLLVVDGKESKYYKTDRSIVKKVFFFLPHIINMKFIWMKSADIRFRLYFSRSSDFDSGWSYRTYWLDLKHHWEMEEIITK